MGRLQRKKDREFWDTITVPLNEDWQTNGLDFVNPVTVADMFARCTGVASAIAGEAERISKEIARLEFQRSQAMRDLKRLRRDVLVLNYRGLAKTASTEMQEIYLLSVMSAEERRQFDELEREVDQLTDQIGQWTPRHEMLKNRLKHLDRNIELMKQYLDFEKIQIRVHMGARG